MIKVTFALIIMLGIGFLLTKNFIAISEIKQSERFSKEKSYRRPFVNKEEIRKEDMLYVPYQEYTDDPLNSAERFCFPFGGVTKFNKGETDFDNGPSIIGTCANGYTIQMFLLVRP